MKIIILLFSLFISAVNAKTLIPNNILEKINEKDVGKSLLEDIKSGDIKSVLLLTDILITLNDKEMVKIAEDILLHLSNKYKIANFHLGYKYLSGAKVAKAEGGYEEVLLNYPKAIKYLNEYIQNPIEGDDKLLTLAINFLGAAYYKSEHYDKAANIYLNNIVLLKLDDTGLSAMYLANLYRDGLGVNKNLKEALKWYNFAAKKGLNAAIMESNFIKMEIENDDK